MIAWVGYAVIGIPIIMYDVLVRNTGLTGIWLGAFAAVFFNSCAFLYTTFTLDWDSCIKKAANRRQMENEQINQTEARVEDDEWKRDKNGNAIN